MNLLTSSTQDLGQILSQSSDMDVDISSIYTEAGAGAAGVWAVIGAFIGIFAVLALIWYILTVIAYWKIFTKAGEPGWKSIIPFYNLYTQYKLTWKPVFFWVYLVLGAVAGGLGDINGTISGLASIATFVMTIVSNYYLSRSFGHGGGFTIGLTFLNNIFTLILGFGKSQYVGNTCEPDSRL